MDFLEDNRLKLVPAITTELQMRQFFLQQLSQISSKPFLKKYMDNPLIRANQPKRALISKY